MSFSMTVDQAVANTYLLATGKTTTLTSGDSKYTKILALLNLFTQQWASESGIDWKSLRNTFTVAATVSATDTYLIPATCGKVSKQDGDFVRIYHTDGVTESDYSIVPIERLYNDGPTINNGGIGRHTSVGTCSIVGSNLVFSTPFASTDAQYGGTIKIPGYSIPATLTTGSDVIAVDDPFYPCYMSAAEFVRNDITRQSQYPNLVSQAASSMQGMKEDNQSQVESGYQSWSPGNGTGGDSWS